MVFWSRSVGELTHSGERKIAYLQLIRKSPSLDDSVTTAGSTPLSLCVTPSAQALHRCQLLLVSISAVPDSYECCERDD